ncbi:MAG: HAD family phosphatase [Verrucomicrobiota bacterium]|nr:HAD family phosphatase [Verrucomicrobiota bacterium]
MIRAFLFDIGNVLLRFDFSPALTKLADQGEVTDLLEVFANIDRIKLAYEDGQIERSAFLRGVFDVLRYRGTETDFVAAWEDIFEPNTPMVELVEQLHGRYPLYLLSNTSDIHRDYLFRRYPFFSLFDAGIYSYEVRASKPSPAIFQQAIERLGLQPKATFFIDDLLPNIEAARSLNFRTHHYHYDQHDALLEALRTLGVQ